jgi:hypothetical protein
MRTARSGAPATQPQEVFGKPVGFRVGQDVTVGEVRWKVLEVNDEGSELTADSEFIDQKSTPGKWVRVRFQVENLSNDSQTFSSVDLVDSQDRTFRPADDVYSYVPTDELCTFDQLNANVPKTCQVVFELPADATGLKLNVGDLEVFGSAEAQIDLGL